MKCCNCGKNVPLVVDVEVGKIRYKFCPECLKLPGVREYREATERRDRRKKAKDASHNVPSRSPYSSCPEWRDPCECEEPQYDFSDRLGLFSRPPMRSKDWI